MDEWLRVVWDRRAHLGVHADRTGHEIYEWVENSLVPFRKINLTPVVVAEIVPTEATSGSASASVEFRDFFVDIYGLLCASGTIHRDKLYCSSALPLWCTFPSHPISQLIDIRRNMV